MFTGEDAMVLTKIMKKEMKTEKNFKTCVRYISLNFYFSPNDSPPKIMINVFLFHLKSSFRSRDIQIFVFWSSPLFPRSAIALEVDSRKILKFMTSSTV